MPSPFIFIVTILTLMSTSTAQFGTEDWLHPGINIFTAKDTSSFMQLYNNSHIGLINFNDSLTITESKRGFRYVKGLGDGVVTFNYNQYRSITEFIEKDYSFNIQNIYSEALFGYEIKRGRITTDLEITKYSGINEISPSLLVSIRFHPRLSGSFGRSISKVPFQFTLNYTDFSYSLNDIYTNHEIYHYGISFMGQKYRIDYKMEEDDWRITSKDSSFSKLTFETGIKRNMFLNGAFYLSSDRIINWTYYKRINQAKLDLNNSSNSSFFEINNYTNDNYVFSLNYQFQFSQYKLHFAIQEQGVDLLISNRISPNEINEDLRSFFNLVPIIANKTFGELKQKMISIKITSNKTEMLLPYVQCDWLLDTYDIHSNTVALTAFGFPVFDLYANNQGINIIGKEAINIRLGCKLSRNNWLADASFSQHVPYKVDVIEEIPEEEKEEIEDMYGGGLFSIAITRLLD